jgi:hypothetical protein
MLFFESLFSLVDRFQYGVGGIEAASQFIAFPGLDCFIALGPEVTEISIYSG